MNKDTYNKILLGIKNVKVHREGIIMKKNEVIVSDLSKKHSNPIAELVQVACQFDSRIILESGTKQINAKSIMRIMAFNPSEGMDINLVAEGQDEDKAIEALTEFFS